MNSMFQKIKYLTLVWLCAWAFVVHADAPTQKPLLSASTGAKPNVVITLDNSGSMSFTFHESYNITSDEKAREDKYCASPYYGLRRDGRSGYIRGEQSRPDSNGNCYELYGGYLYETTSGLTSFSPIRYAGTTYWEAQRSADVNPIYYNPRVTYRARVDAAGNALVPTDGIRFVSNQNSTSFFVRVDGNNVLRGLSFYDGASSATNAGWYAYNSSVRHPSHRAWTTGSPTAAFTWVVCSNVTVNAAGQEIGCDANSMRIENITATRTADVTLPSNHRRTDCANAATNKCTPREEIANILNWYRYYGYRSQAVATSIGLALANQDYRETLRLGYYNINNNGVANTLVLGGSSGNPGRQRGVRLSSVANNTTLYNWLYGFGSIPRGGTPLHGSTVNVADYYKQATNDHTDRPWAADPGAPVSRSNPELSCRRSFNILFSDGAWNNGTSNNASATWDNTNFTGSLPAGNKNSLFTGYQWQGVNSEQGRKLFTPYGSSAAGGLADLTAQYYWHQDFRDGLANEIRTKPGQPTYWQNMATYTVGYLIRPSGELPGATSGLTFQQIRNYQQQYAANGYAASTKPSWPTGTPNAGTGTAADQARIDDFIQAGFTGGGAGFSVTTSDDVRRTFDIILADILNASGRDAGVSVSGAAATSTLEGKIRYTAEYSTVDNSGELVATRIDANGKDVAEVWRATEQVPALEKRKLFTRAANGARHTLEPTTKLNTLPADLKDRITNNNSRIPQDERFIKYLLGDDTVTDNNGDLFRQRKSPIASSVNSPPLYVGQRVNMGYASANSDVTGKDNYGDFLKSKASLPGTMYMATNGGIVHVFNAADSANNESITVDGAAVPPGQQVAAYLMRSTMPKLADFANPVYDFKYLLDGSLVEADLYINTGNANAWHNLVLGSAGRGAKGGVFALNSPLKGGNRVPGQNDYLWETTAPDMGYITNGTNHGITRGGQQVILSTSGHYAGTGKVGLYVLDANNGDVLRFIELPSGFNAGIGMGGVTGIRDVKRRLVGAYAGDANGNLWRFDLSGATADSWKVSYGKPLFTTPNNQPIYAAPTWQIHPDPSESDGKTTAIVVIGTGILLQDSHKADTSTQSIYGIWDPTRFLEQGNPEVPGFNTPTLADMLQQELVPTSATAGSGVNSTRTFYTVTEHAINWKKHKGWYLNLGVAPNTTGERVVGDLFNVGNSVGITTVVVAPAANLGAESCEAGSAAVNLMYGLDGASGGLKRSFDIDGDGKFDKYSVAYLPEGGFTRSNAVVKQSTGEGGGGTPVNESLPTGSTEPKPPCTGEQIFAVGVGGALGMADPDCPNPNTNTSGVTSWNRAWRQILNPPS